MPPDPQRAEHHRAARDVRGQRRPARRCGEPGRGRRPRPGRGRCRSGTSGSGGQLGQHRPARRNSPTGRDDGGTARRGCPRCTTAAPSAVEHLHVLAATSVEQCGGIIGTALAQERPGRAGVRRGAGGREQRDHRRPARDTIARMSAAHERTASSRCGETNTAGRRRAVRARSPRAPIGATRSRLHRADGRTLRTPRQAAPLAGRGPSPRPPSPVHLGLRPASTSQSYPAANLRPGRRPSPAPARRRCTPARSRSARPRRRTAPREAAAVGDDLAQAGMRRRPPGSPRRTPRPRPSRTSPCRDGIATASGLRRAAAHFASPAPSRRSGPASSSPSRFTSRRTRSSSGRSPAITRSPSTIRCTCAHAASSRSRPLPPYSSRPDVDDVAPGARGHRRTPPARRRCRSPRPAPPG